MRAQATDVSSNISFAELKMSEQIRQFLKANKPIPITEEERVSLMRVSKKSIFIMLTVVIVWLILWAKDGFDMGMLGFGVSLIIFIGIILFFLEIRDKIKYKSYDKIYSTYVFIESAYYVNKAYHVEVSYYDFQYGLFAKTKMNIDRVDVKEQRIGVGAVINVFVGEKKSKIHYIAMKSM